MRREWGAVLIVPAAVAAAVPANPSHAAMPASDAAPLSGVCGNIPAGTPVLIEIVDTIQSRTAKIGGVFGIRLAQPLIIDGEEILSAGIVGAGEVIHASRPKFLNSRAGELILAARYLDLGGRRLPLRGFRLGATGTTWQTIYLGGGMAETSENVEIPAGSVATAKIAGDCIDMAPTTAVQSVKETLTPSPG